jgi:hypothetical protein
VIYTIVGPDLNSCLPLDKSVVACIDLAAPPSMTRLRTTSRRTESNQHTRPKLPAVHQLTTGVLSHPESYFDLSS